MGDCAIPVSQAEVLVMTRELRTELPVGWEKRVALMIFGSDRRCVAVTIAAKRLGVEVGVLEAGLVGSEHFRVERKASGLSIRPNWPGRVPAELRLSVDTR